MLASALALDSAALSLALASEALVLASASLVLAGPFSSLLDYGELSPLAAADVADNIRMTEAADGTNMLDKVHTWAVVEAVASALDKEFRTSAAFAVAAPIAPERRGRCGGRKRLTSHLDSARMCWCAVPAKNRSNHLAVTWLATLLTFGI